jgi:tetratricopeptide (TPR) repeat protein
MFMRFAFLAASLAASTVLLSAPAGSAVIAGNPAEQQSKLSPFEQGMAAMRAKQYVKAEKWFNEAALKDPKAPQPLLALAELARIAKKDAEAERLIRKAAEIAPNDAASQMALGLLLYSKGKYADAEAQLQLTAALAPKIVQPLLALADLYMGPLQQPAKAVDVLSKVIALEPANPGGHLGLGTVYLTQKDYSNGLAEMNKARSLAPRNPMPLLALAQAYADLGKSKDALADLQEAAKLAPQSAEIPLRMGMIYQQSQQWDQAFAAYEQAVKLDGKLVAAYNNLAWLSAERKQRLDEGEAWAAKAVALAPQAPALQDTYAWVKRARGDLKGALQLLQVASSTGNPEIVYHLGIVQQEMGRKDEARASFKRALDISPKFSQAPDALQRMQQLH